MRLSDAIRLGAMLRPQGFGTQKKRDAATTACALEAARLAIGREWRLGRDCDPLITPWPWTLEDRVRCPECGDEDKVDFVIAVHLNDRHRWTRERIADWVATVEPANIPLDSSVTDATVSVPTEQPQEAAR